MENYDSYYRLNAFKETKYPQRIESLQVFNRFVFFSFA